MRGRLDDKGLHARSCRKGEWLVNKHKSVVDELAVWCEDNHAYTIKEAIIPNANPDHPESNIDLISLLYRSPSPRERQNYRMPPSS